MKRKFFVFSMLLAAVLLTSNLYAQEKQGGLFGKDWFSGLFSSDDANAEELEAEEYQGLFAGNNRGNSTVGFEASNQPFGVEATSPLGSGVLMLVAAGAGYALLKRKEEKN